MNVHRRFLGLLGLVIVPMIASCAPPPRAATPGAPGAAAESPPSKTLTSLLKVEPESLAAKPVRSTGTSVAHGIRLFNAGLVLLDGQENPLSDLVDAVPRLNTDSWRLFPDGQMETTYRLKPHLTWQDGAPLRAEDFVFARRVPGAAHGVRVTGVGGRSGEPEELDDDRHQVGDQRLARIKFRRLAAS